MKTLDPDIYACDTTSAPMARDQGPRCRSCRALLRRAWAEHHIRCVSCLYRESPRWYVHEGRRLKLKMGG